LHLYSMILAPYTPVGDLSSLFPGTWYLASVDEKHRRKYEVAGYTNGHQKLVLLFVTTKISAKDSFVCCCL